MNLLDLMVKIGAQDNASKTIDSVASSTIAKATAMGQAMYEGVKFGVTRIADGVKTMVTSVVDNFGTYEQLSEGAKLAFGDAYDYIEKRSKEAYRNVQMSQNDYLQQVNGLAVGLRESMGGNSEAAAELADKVVTAEADIVAAMGISQDAAQNAFNGIMKGNYMMLDNLQLGIKPTKEGMQEVIDKVNDWRNAQGKAGNLTIDSLADCQAAVVDYVEMMGYAGYASQEGMDTIQGSISAAKAAWDNLITSIGTGDPEGIQQAVNGLVVTLFGTWSDETQKREGGLINNILPVVENVASAITQRIPSIATTLGFQFVQAFMQALGFDSVEIDDFILDLESKFDSAKETITNVFTEVSTAVGDFFASFSGTADAGYLTIAMQKIQDIASQVWGFIEQNILPHADEIGEFLGNVANLMGSVATTALTVISNLGPVIPMIAGAVGFVSLIAPIASIIGTISGAITFFTTVLMPALSMIQSVGGLIAVVTTLLGGPLTIIVAIAGALIGLIATNEDARAAIATAWEAIKAKGEELLEWFSTLPAKIGAFFDGVGELLTEAGRNIISGLLNGLKEKFEDVKSWVGGIGSWIASHKGPKQYDLGLLVQNGEWIMAGLQEGLQRGLPPVEDTLSDITDSIQTGINANADVSVAQAPSTDAAILSTLNMILNAIPDGVYLDKRTLVGNLAPSMNVAMGRL